MASVLERGRREHRDSDQTDFVLRRLTYGITDAGRARAHEVGVDGWLAEQLDPSSLDRTALSDELRGLKALSLDSLYAELPADVPASMAGAQLQLASLIRQTRSPAQLFERMVEFWSDHFNVPLGDRFQVLAKIVEDRDVIRHHALGTFADLLVASAQSPAMLRYLDNARSFAGAMNENYARELLELHTVGLNGGATEDDVVSVARLLTGWTFSRAAGGFAFASKRHDDGPLEILGWSRPTTGSPFEHGEMFLRWVAVHPATARHVCTKLARRFGADDPPELLVEAMARAWVTHDSSIPAVLTAMVEHELFSPALGPKFNRPIDQFVWVLRTLGARIVPQFDRQGVRQIARLVRGLGQVPFGWPAPNGYPDVEVAWRNASSLLARWNATGDVVSGEVPIIALPASDEAVDRDRLFSVLAAPEAQYR